tara:strand:+ start:1798 stop:2658 length:861 start_codon:yes stop_codon:yes gene_type:complete
MSTGLSTAFTQLFDAEVKQAYAGTSVLQNVCRMRTGVEGSSVNFPTVGSGSAIIRTPATDIVPLNTSFGTVSCSLTDYVAGEYSDIFNQQKVNFSERSELAQVVGGAIARRQDQVILDALATASAGSTVANSIVTSGSASASNLNVGKIIKASELLNTKNVPPTDRFMVIHASGLASLLADERAVSADYASLKALTQGGGQIGQFMGFQIIVLGDRSEGGLSKDGSNDRTNFAFHKSALGCAVGIAPKTEVNYIAEKTSFLVTAMLSMGAVAIDADGICDVTTREA